MLWAVSHDYLSTTLTKRISVLARQAAKFQSPLDTPPEDGNLLDEGPNIRNDVRLTLIKLRLKTCHDHVIVGTFILEILLSRELPRALKLQLKKQLRKLESVTSVFDPLESQQDAPEVMCSPNQFPILTDRFRLSSRSLQR